MNGFRKLQMLLVACSYLVIGLTATICTCREARGADRTRPVITTFTLPATSSTLAVTGIVLAATDNVGVTGYFLSTSSTTPSAGAGGWSSSPPTSYTFTSAGTKTLYAWAKDAAGNRSARKSATVRITSGAPDTQPPTVSITSPANGAVVSGTITITASASDNVGVTKVEFYVNGTLDVTDTIAPYTDSGNTATIPDGSYVLTARAYDAAGNVGQSSPVTMIIKNSMAMVYEIDTTEPGTGTIVSPFDTLNIWTPDFIPYSYAEMFPMIRYISYFNATGGMVNFPENELYDEDAAGNPVYHFDRLTSKIDTILAAGFKPYLSLSFTPLKLASNPSAVSSQFGSNTSPPKDWNKYYDFIKAFFTTLNTTYGAEEVATWRFRCGTEPDNIAWWSGTRDEWFKFYDYTVSAARAANPDVHISINPGNFMSPDTSFISALAARIQAGTFSIPGEQPDMPTVISFSYYIDNPVHIAESVSTIRTSLAPYPAFATVPLAIDEGYILDDENGLIMYSRLDGTELGGAHFALLTSTLVDHDLKWGAVWNAGSHEVPPPARNVLDLFQQMLVGGRNLNGALLGGYPTGNDVVGGLAVRPEGAASGHLHLMLFNYNASRSAADSEPVVLRLKNIPSGGVNVAYYRIDRDHANYSARWLADSAGMTRSGLSPYDLEPLDGMLQEGFDLWDANKSIYADLAKVVPEPESSPRIPAADGSVEIPLTLPPHGVVFITVDPLEATYTVSGTISPAPPANGTTVTLAQGTTTIATTTADASGAYTFTSAVNGVYTVTPVKTGLTFTPVSAPVTVNSANAAGINFTASGSAASSLTVNPTTIAGGASSQGTVTLTGPAPTGGATVALSDNSSATDLPPSVYVPEGSSSAAFTITSTTVPTSTSVTISAVFGGVTKTATLTVTPTGSSAVSGAISPALSGSGATVTLTQGTTTIATATVAADGTYTFPSVANGIYTVTPHKTGFTFSPVSATATVNGANVTGINFNAAGLVIDVTTYRDSSSFATSIATSSFTTREGNELLLAFVSAAAVSSSPAVTGVTGGGLTWTPVRTASAQLSTAEIWKAVATTPLTNVTVTASLSQSSVASITVVAFAGVNPVTPVGAVGGGYAASGAPSASLTTQGANSWVFGVGTDWDHAKARTLGPNQTMAHQNLDPNDYTSWVQRQNAAVQPAGTVVTINDTAPTSDRWNLSIVEIRQ